MTAARRAIALAFAAASLAATAAPAAQATSTAPSSAAYSWPCPYTAPYLHYMTITNGYICRTKPGVGNDPMSNNLYDPNHCTYTDTMGQYWVPVLDNYGHNVRDAYGNILLCAPVTQTVTPTNTYQ